MRSIDWAAGLFEGEGCVSIARRRSAAFTSEAGRCTPVLALKMTDRHIVEEFAAVMGCGYIAEQPYYEAHGHKAQWRWQTKNLTEVSRCIDLLYPHMGNRRRGRMDEVRALLAAKRERRVELARVQIAGKRIAIARDADGRFA